MVDCVCTAPECVGVEREFEVPVAFLAPGRAVGRIPDRCPACVAHAEQREAERVRREETARAVQEAERNASSVLARVEAAGGNPYEFADVELATFRAKPGREKALAATQEWTASVLETRDKYARVRGLYLVGYTGTGKTALAHAALRALLEAGMEPVRGVVFDDSLSLIERVQGTYGSDDSTWALLEVRINARVWILDDLGAEKPSDDVVRKLSLIFNRRQGKPTLVTSNDEPGVLCDRNGAFFRLESRFGPAQFRVVRAAGDDARFDRPGLEKVRDL